MWRLLVRRGGSGIAIDLDENKPRRIILLLNDIEPGHTLFFKARPGIRQRRSFKLFHCFRFDMNMNVNNEHIFYKTILNPTLYGVEWQLYEWVGKE